jgi:thiamine-monophosphate kinase
VETLAEVGEFNLIERVTKDLVRGPAVSVGPGDDAAVFLINPSADMSTDAMVEGIHFRRDWSSAFDIGRKAVAVSVSDIEAMGATPIALTVAFVGPSDLEADWVADLTAGLSEEADKARVSVVGGDISAGSEIMLTMTVVGELNGAQPITRAGAHVGDAVAICGRLGWSAAGLTVLSRGFRSPRAVVQAYQCPTPPYGAGDEARRFHATSMIDISDGLLADLTHIADASEVTISLDTTKFDVAEPIQAVAQAIGEEPLVFVLTGGEDHVLAATFAPADVPPTWTVVGEVVEAANDRVLVDGNVWDRPNGWTHF